MSGVPVRLGLPLCTQGNVLSIICSLFKHKWVAFSGGPVVGRECSRCKRAELKFVSKGGGE